MKQFNTNVFGRMFFKRLFLTAIAAVAGIFVYAANITSIASGNWNVPGTWSSGTVPTAADNVTISNGNTVTINAGGATCQDITISAGGTLVLSNNGLTVAGNWINNGTFKAFGNGGSDDNPTGDNVTFTGSAATIGGSTISAFSGLTINPGAGGTVTVLTNEIDLGSPTSTNVAGRLTLQSGLLDVGAGHTFSLLGYNSRSLTSTGGNFKSYGPSGFTVKAALDFGNTLTLAGAITLDNISVASTSAANFKIQISNANSVHFNGVVAVQGGQAQNWGVSGNAPIWGPASTLSLNTNGQTFSLQPNGNGNHQEWLPMATGTIGVTPGYPNNVILSNIGSSQGGYNNGNGWVSSVSWAINGTLTLGDNTNNAQVDFSNVPSFSCGGLVINTNSRFTAPKGTMTVNGSWTDNQPVSGTSKGFFINGTSSIAFGGGSCGTPNTITIPAGSTNYFYDLSLVNNAYVQLNSPVSVSHTLALTSGIMQTSLTNVLSITSNSTTAITGGSSSSFINGPLSRAIATGATTYSFPVGGITCPGTTTYLPLSLSSTNPSGNTITAQAFNTGSGGTGDATINTLDQSAYWYVATTAAVSPGATVSVTIPGSVGTNNSLAKSLSAAGTYTAIGGNASGNSVTNANIGTSFPIYLALAEARLAAINAGSTSVSCSGTTATLQVAGIGGTPLYGFKIDGDVTYTTPLAASHTFNGLSGGYHSVYIKDAAGNQAGPFMMKVPGAVQINNDNDTNICANQPVVLTARNLMNTSPAYSWTSNRTGATVLGTSATLSVASVPDTTTYYVSSVAYDPANNLLVNPSFESGSAGVNTPANFYSDFTIPSGMPYGTTPGPDATGYFSVQSQSNLMCGYYTTNNANPGPPFLPQDGNMMLVCDGPAVATPYRPWYETVNVIPNTTYKFTFYYQEANPNGNRPVLQAKINGTALGPNITLVNPSMPSYSPSSWQTITYYWASNTNTTAKIEIWDNNASGNTDGNDFLIDNIQFISPCPVIDSFTVYTGGTVKPGKITPTTPSFCAGSAPASDLTLGGYTATILHWEASSSSSFSSPTIIVNNTPTLTIAEIQALNLTSDTYFRVATSGCSTTLYSDTVKLSVNPLPSVLLGTMPSTCYSAAAQTVAIPYTGATASPTKYTITNWSDPAFTDVNNASLPVDSISIAVPASLAVGVYQAKLTLSNANGCISKDTTIKISVTAPPVLVVTGSDPTGCGFSDGYIKISGLTPAITYRLSYDTAGVAVAPADSTADGSGTIYIRNLKAGDYDNITISTTSGTCSSNGGSITLSDPPPPGVTVTASSNSPVCEGGIIQLATTLTPATPGASFSWSNATSGYTSTGVSDPSILNAAVKDSGTYKVKVTISGCVLGASTAVEVDSVPKLKINDPAVSCTGAGVDITAASVTSQSTLPSGTALSYWQSFSPATPLATPSDVSPTGTYYIVATSGVCSDTADINVVVDTFPAAPTPVGSAFVSQCQQFPTQTLQAQATAPPGAWVTWYDETGTEISSSGASLNTIGTVNYYAQSNDAAGCVSTSRTEFTLQIVPSPRVTVDDSIVYIDQGYYGSLVGHVTPLTGVTYYWTPSTDVMYPDSLYTFINPSTDRTYNLIAYANTASGVCSDTASVRVMILAPVTIPNAFSPNGDHVHDTWYLNLEQYPDAEVDVFNRYGQMVFQSKGNYISNQWDGTTGGKPLPTGPYYYIIHLNSGTSRGSKPITGSVSIVR